MKVIIYLDCGCTFLEDGSRSWCPTCSNPPPQYDPWIDISAAPRGGKHGKLIVTNNINARDAHGFMSHAWLVSMVHDTPEVVMAYGDSGYSIFGITHFIPLPESQCNGSVCGEEVQG